MDPLTLIGLKSLPEPQPIYVLSGEERLLKRLALRRLRELILGETDDELAYVARDGDDLTFAAVNDELLTRPFLSPRKLVLVTEADGFVSAHREKLERYAARPSKIGHLILEVKSWKSTTRLAKIIPANATIACEGLKGPALKKWLIDRTQAEHGQKLEGAAADLLIEYAGPDLGILEQEAAKLAAYVGEGNTIAAKDVDALVGQNRLETAWAMLDALAAGQGSKALETLHRLLLQGEDVHKLLGAMSWQLRKVAQVARLQQLGVSLGDAVSRAGLPPFKREQVGQSLRHLGPRAYELYDLLLETDSALKSSDRLSDLGLMQKFLVQLSKPLKR